MFARIVKLFPLTFNFSLFRDPGPSLRFDQHNCRCVDFKGVSTGQIGNVLFVQPILLTMVHGHLTRDPPFG
jgi:hypothetical protein